MKNKWNIIIILIAVVMLFTIFTSEDVMMTKINDYGTGATYQAPNGQVFYFPENDNDTIIVNYYFYKLIK